MITLIEGLPGAGKSYEATTKHVLPALVKKDKEQHKSKFKALKESLLAFLPRKKKDEDDEARYIVTNLPLNLEYIESQGYDTSYIIKLESKRIDDIAHRPFSFLSDITDYESMRVKEGGLGPLYIIDECQIIFPPTTPSDDTYRDFENWFTEHRHSSSDVVLITQNWDQINKKIAKLTQVKKRLKKLNNLSLNNSYKAFYFDNVRLSSAKATYRQEMRKYKKEYFGFYSSYTKGGNGEAGIQDQKAVWRSWKVYFAILFIIWAIYKILNADLSVLTGEKKEVVATDNISRQAEQAMLNASASSRVSSPSQRISPPVEQETCEHPFSDYEFSYSHTKGERYFFFIYENGRKLNSVFSSTQLRHSGYILSSIYFEDVVDIYKTEYYDHGLRHRQVKIHEKANIFSAVLKHKDCSDFSIVITHLDKEKKKIPVSSIESKENIEDGDKESASLLDMFKQ